MFFFFFRDVLFTFTRYMFKAEAILTADLSLINLPVVIIPVARKDMKLILKGKQILFFVGLSYLARI